MRKRIVIEFMQDGSVLMEGHGFSGPGCEKATRFLEEALGKVKTRVKKPEYYQAAGAKQQQEASQ